MELEVWRGWRGQRGPYGPAIGQLSEGRATNHINLSLQILDPEIQQESRDFISTNHLASMKANLTILIPHIIFIWFKFLVTAITVLEVHSSLWKCDFFLKNLFHWLLSRPGQTDSYGKTQRIKKRTSCFMRCSKWHESNWRKNSDNILVYELINNTSSENWKTNESTNQDTETERIIYVV